MKKIFIVFISLLSCFPALAQEKLGVANSNYSSTNSIFLNPSSSVDSRTLFQFNLIGANIYAMNNLVYLPHFSIRSAMKEGFQTPKASTIGDKGFKTFIDFKTEINGPAFVVSNKEIGYGVFVRARAEGSITNIPSDMVKTALGGNNSDSLLKHLDVNLRNVNVKEMAWVEYGVNFGKMYFKHGTQIITIGGNARYLTGVNLVNATIYRFNATLDEKNFTLPNLNATYKYNTPGWNTGKGIGIDLGITYKKDLEFVDSYYSNSQKSSCKQIDYKYKIGASLLDLGAIRFTQNTFTGNPHGSPAFSDFSHGNVDSVLRADFNVTPQTGKTILACLPTALSVQGDWNLKHHFYVSGTIIQAMTVARITGVQRSSLLSIAPRFETRNIEIAMPLTFHRYLYPQLGLAFRYRTFYLGMDNVLPLIIKNNTYGASVYFGFGVSIFKNPKCKVSHPRYNPVKVVYEGFTFLSLKNKPKRSVVMNASGDNNHTQGAKQSRFKLSGDGGESSGPKKRFRFKNLFRRSKKL
jgi:hypothetical protein